LRHAAADREAVANARGEICAGNRKQFLVAVEPAAVLLGKHPADGRCFDRTEEEAREREEFPPVDTNSPEPQDAAGRVGEQPLTDLSDRHTSHKAGSRSIAQKEAGARYPDRSMPATHKVDGAFGKEPKEPEEPA
jgi:hypothetical protein